jgi:hypothetical protein
LVSRPVAEFASRDFTLLPPAKSIHIEIVSSSPKFVVGKLT